MQVAHKEAIMCVKCGGALGKPSFQSQTSSTRNFQSHVTPHEIAEAARSCKKTFGYGPEYYQKKFQEFEDNGGSFKATWNWPAFLVAALFYMYNGLWGKAALLIVVSLLFFPIAWLYAGIAFNYDLYLYKVKGKNFW